MELVSSLINYSIIIYKGFDLVHKLRRIRHVNNQDEFQLNGLYSGAGHKVPEDCVRISALILVVFNIRVPLPVRFSFLQCRLKHTI
jgi:hypothetical protein